MKSKNKTDHLAATPTDYSQPWVTDTAWITGLTGAFAILAVGFLFGSSRLHVTGLEFIQASAQEEKNAVILLALCTVSILMIAVELVRLALFKGFEFICKDPLLAQGKFGDFIVDAIKRYLALLLLFLSAAGCIFHVMNTAISLRVVIISLGFMFLMPSGLFLYLEGCPMCY